MTELRTVSNGLTVETPNRAEAAFLYEEIFKGDSVSAARHRVRRRHGVRRGSEHGRRVERVRELLESKSFTAAMEQADWAVLRLMDVQMVYARRRDSQDSLHKADVVRVREPVQ
jgi:hypothetical protein